MRALAEELTRADQLGLPFLVMHPGAHLGAGEQAGLDKIVGSIDAVFAVIPKVEMFNAFNNKNNVNPLVTPGLFNFDGFLRQGVGDPLQVQLSVKFAF